eukprot:38861-Chlamydomonas_euryale.AAC.1
MRPYEAGACFACTAGRLETGLLFEALMSGFPCEIKGGLLGLGVMDRKINALALISGFTCKLMSSGIVRRVRKEGWCALQRPGNQHTLHTQASSGACKSVGNALMLLLWQGLQTA